MIPDMLDAFLHSVTVIIYGSVCFYIGYMLGIMNRRK
jgi:hypothetical protein